MCTYVCTYVCTYACMGTTSLPCVCHVHVLGMGHYIPVCPLSHLYLIVIWDLEAHGRYRL